jgi:hypothetical protein
VKAACFSSDFDVLRARFLAAAVRFVREPDEGDKVGNRISERHRVDDFLQGRETIAEEREGMIKTQRLAGFSPPFTAD